MDRIKSGAKGFTLIAAMLLLLLMSGVAIGLLMMVNTEGRVGGNDLEHNIAYHAAEGGIENMTSGLANMFQNIQSPSAAQLATLDNPPTNDPSITYPGYTVTQVLNPNGTPWSQFGPITSGPDAGLYAELLQFNLSVTAQRPLGDQVSMNRLVEVALIPVFQFGIFSDSDLSFFAGPNLDFQGRVHTNGDLYLSEGTGGTVTFHDQVSAWGNIVRWELPNWVPTNGGAAQHLGSVDVLTASQGCDGAKPKCRDMGADTVNGVNEGSVTTGTAANTWTTSGQNGGWNAISTGTYNGWIINGNYGNPGGTGAVQLSLPFVNGTSAAAGQAQPFEIIRRPPVGEVATSPLGSARLYNEAQIRVLLADTPADLPGGVGDAQNIRLANVGNYVDGVAASTPAGLPVLASGGSYNTYFAEGNTSYPATSTWTNTKVQVYPSITPVTLQPDWPYQPVAPLAADVTFTNDQGPPAAPIVVANVNGLTAAPPVLPLSTCTGGSKTVSPTCQGAANPYYSAAPYPNYTLTPAANTASWNLNDGYIRVEYKDAGGNVHPVTSEWLALGFARGQTPPTVPGTGNPINPNAILLLQEPADRNFDGAIDTQGAPPGPCTKSGSGNSTVWSCVPGKPPEVTVDSTTASAWYGDSKAGAAQSVSMYNWYPINFYDAREGEVRDVNNGNTCTPMGIMNTVELDVGNLQRWLNGTIPGSGTSVDYLVQNGYILYFSDRRGMLPNPNGTQVDPVNTKTGDAGFEDAINTPNANGQANGALEPAPLGKTQSPEDVNNNGVLDNFGAGNLGLGFGYIGAAYNNANSVNSKILNAGAAPDPYMTAGRITTCPATGGKNWVSGARHVLRLVDGSLGNVPVRLDNGQGGFTVASENPLYVYGNYNSSAADPTWANPNAANPAHAAAAVIADAVTMLSNSWSDINSFNSPDVPGGRNATTTYYRVAVAGGKNINFPITGLAWAAGDYGTDGGLHNFLRLLENWGGQTLNYKGSLVSMYYSTYATGTDKNGGASVDYSPPTRNYTFDPLFAQPQNLPPGTPMFRDIDNLSYTQIFTPRAN